jgi:hypothetical protein
VNVSNDDWAKYLGEVPVDIRTALSGWYGVVSACSPKM